MRLPVLLISFSLLLQISCTKEEIQEILNESSNTSGTDSALTQSELISGLKTALTVGTDSSTNILSKLNGYYGNPLVKIPLPPEAESIRTSINNLSNSGLIALFSGVLDDEFENVVLAINRSAESAAAEAAPIFKNAITSLSISDGWQILRGVNPAAKKELKSFDSLAATNYFISVTRTPLTNLYAPKIDNALSGDLGLGFSANDAWNTLRTTYNNIYNTATTMGLSGALSSAGLSAMQTTTIGEFATAKALDGLFLKVGEQERLIRRNPFKWVGTLVEKILSKVFGYQY